MASIPAPDGASPIVRPGKNIDEVTEYWWPHMKELGWVNHLLYRMMKFKLLTEARIVTKTTQSRTSTSQDEAMTG
jgi:hypothetical protein